VRERKPRFRSLTRPQTELRQANPKIPHSNLPILDHWISMDDVAIYNRGTAASRATLPAVHTEFSMRIQSDIPVAARASFLAGVQASLERSLSAPLRAVARSVRSDFAKVAVATVALATSVIATSAITSLASAAPAAIPPQPRAGTQLPDLTASQQMRFALGRVAYETPLEVADGLGPAFNQTSCAACHETPIGGWGATRVTHFGNLSGGNFDFLEALGGPVLQRFAISTACEEELPPAAIANHVRDRVTPSVLAFGLVEAISDDAILALADPNDANGDGISGRAHLVVPLEDPASPLRVGRFGWKAQIATIRSFSGDAARNEMGLTNAVIASETAPNGDAALLADCDDIPDIEDAPDAFGASFVDRVTDFQRYLAPPPQSPRSGMAGESIFNAVGCVNCHARQFITSSSEALEPVLRAQTIRPYSDFLLHDMGSLADGIPDGNALPTEMRTPPLWNLRTRPVLLHDGSANAPLFAARVESAILAHAGEGLASRNAYAALSAADKAKVIAFLDSLGRDDYDVDGDGLLTNLDLGIIVAHAADASVTPDEAWAVADLDQDGQIESDEVNGLRSLLGVPADCNQNGLADWSEIATGATNDQNGNGVPDECDQSNCTARVKRVTGTGGAIPDAGGGSLSRSISVTAPAGNPSIQSIRVSLDINHTWASDLTITLRRGTDAPITLHSGCGTFHDLNGRYQLVDTAWEGAPGTLNTICQGTLIDNGNANSELRFTFAPGTYRPAQGTASTGFQTMRGQSMAANWTLTITDSRSNDVGTLVSWSLDFRYADPSPTDCDGTGGPDCAQIVADPSLDCDHDGIIDSCQPLGGDCDANGVRDRCQVAEGTATDCNANGTLDICEIAAGSTRDCNANGVPDTCEIADGDEADVDLDTILDRCERAFGDLDLDGTVGAADLALLLSVWGTPNPPFADFDGDGIVAAADLSLLLSKWGASPPWMVPTISSVTPNTGPAAGGTAITITGTNLTGASSVTIGGVAATSVSVVNSTTVTAVTPAGAAGAQSVSVTTPSGTASLAGAFTYQAASPPTIASVTPNAGGLAGGTAITITGTNLTGTSSVTIGGTAATSVSVVNATTVTAVTPAGTAGAKTLSLTTPGGTANLSNGFTYVAAPTVTSITPNSGATTGGTAVTISGAGFTGATGVSIGGVAATSVVVVNATTITANAPALSAGVYTVAVTTPYGSGSLANAYTAVVYPPPTVSSITPNVGPIAGGTAVTISGSDFTGATSVTIGGVAATNLVVVSTSTITATTPAGTAGAKNVVVTSPWGQGTLTNGFTYFAPPTISSVSPNVGPTAGGTAITITGTNLTGTSSVTIGGTAATSVSVVNSTTVTAVTPAGTSGAKTVSLTTPGGTANLSNGFTYGLSPSISSVTPNVGPTAGGTAITITGTNLTGTSSVTVGGSAATSVSVVNSTTVTAVTPAGSAGAANVSLTTPYGTATANGAFTYQTYSTPTISSVAPNSGSTAGGTAITITGTNLTGTSSVTIGGTAATSVSVVNSTTVTAVTPAGTSGAKTVSLTTFGGTANLTNGFTYTTVWYTVLEQNPDPAIVTSATRRNAITATGYPWRVRDNGTNIEMVLIPPGTFNMGCTASNAWACDSDESPVHSVTLTSAFYMGRYEVTQAQWIARMGSNPSYFQSSSAQVTAAQVPNRPVEQVSWNMIAGTGGFLSGTGLRLPTEAEWEYACRAGTTTAFHGFTGYLGGTNDDTLVGSIAWYGSNSSSQTRPVGGKLANGFGLHDMSGNVWEWVNDWYSSSYYASSPSSNPTGPATGSSRVFRGGSWDSGTYFVRSSARLIISPDYAGAGFRVARAPDGTEAPAITSLSPASGSTDGGTLITITGTNLTGTSSVTIGGVAATNLVVVSTSTITATTPAGTAGAKNVVVTSPWGQGTLTNGFTYFAQPTISSVSPNAGPTAGGTPITITGTNLTGTSSVTIGGTAATSVSVVNATTVTAVTPAGTAGAKTVSLTTPGGTANLTNGFTYGLSPSISSVTPNVGPTAGGTAITITGTNLTGTSSVTVGGTAATSVSVVNSTTVTAVTPAGTSGAKTVSLTTPGGTANLSNGFTYYPVPTISAVSPASGSTAGGTAITITGTNLTGTSSVTIGGAAATSVSVVNVTTVTAVTPAGTSGAKTVSLTTPDGTANLANGFIYANVTVPSWATLLEPLPDPAIVTSATLRNAITATGYPWRVRDNGTNIEMVLIPPGTFNMGCTASNASGCSSDEFPVHSVTLTSAFYMGRYEVTQAQWIARMGSNPSYFQPPNNPTADTSRPVEKVSWNQIAGTGGFLSGTGLRLPTEAEWEYAYRAGTTTAFHGFTGYLSGTNDDTLVENIAWFSGNNGAFGTPTYGTKAVGQKLANGFGLHDMSGNVYEWVNDWYSSTYYASSPSSNPTGPATGSSRVFRGGSWVDFYAFLVRSSYRNLSTPGSAYDFLGFRVARAPL
jgi:formylglycine-generating enzyme required for sulfatase activity/CxxC motif-containing protein (DUF1111 family)/subtilisin-like proprotein convertase family protein